MDGGIGRDTLTGGDGYDYLYGGLGNDGLSGGDGDDQLIGGRGYDFYLGGGAGNDIIVTGELDGITSADFDLVGMASDVILQKLDQYRENEPAYYGFSERVFGGDGHDDIYSAGENNMLFGEGGDDKFYFKNGTDFNANYVFGGGGSNQYHFYSEDNGEGTTAFTDLIVFVAVDQLSDEVNEYIRPDMLHSAIEQLVYNAGLALNPDYVIFNVNGSDTFYLDGTPRSGLPGDQEFPVIDLRLPELTLSLEDIAILPEEEPPTPPGEESEDTDPLDPIITEGTEGGDQITGGSGHDRLSGGGGADTIEGGEGADLIDGGEGSNDTADYSNSSYGVWVSLLDGEGYEDVSFGVDAQGNEIVFTYGGEGAGDQLINIENLQGSVFADILEGDGSSNRLSGGKGDDELIGFGGNDTITGGEGADFLTGGQGADQLRGDEGDDFLQGDEGKDNLSGGGGADILEGGAGIDEADYSDSNEGIIVDLGEGAGIGGHAEGDLLIEIENVSGSDYDDILIGDEGRNILIGRDGDDILSGLGGNDQFILFEGDGVDAINGGEGLDVVDIRSEQAVSVDFLTGTIQQTDGSILANVSGVENVQTGSGNDTVTGSDGINHLRLGEGNDSAYGGIGDDALFGEAGDDILTGGAGSDLIDGGEGNDLVIFDGEREGYEISLNESGSFYEVRDLRSGTGENADIDHLINIERVQIGGIEYDLTSLLNTAPVVSNSLTDQSSPEDTTFSFMLPADTFSDPDGDVPALSATLVDGSALPDWLSFDSGTRAFSGTPPQDFNGSLDVRVTASDGELEASDTFTLEITPVNDAPEAVNDSGLSVDGGQVLIVAAEDLIANDSDIDGDQFSIVSVQDAVNGAVLLNTDGNVEFSPAPGFDGTASFTYTISDGLLTSVASVKVTVNDVSEVITGTNGFDMLEGTDGTDAIFALGGNDRIIGSPGGDVIDGGAGQRDVIEYRDSTAGVNVDLQAGVGAGGFAEGDTYSEIENVYGSQHDDTLIGDASMNHLYGNDGNDILQGGLNNDRLHGGAGADVNDGGEGSDEAGYYGSTEGVTINLPEGIGAGGHAEGDTLISIENVWASAHDDMVVGNEFGNIIHGGAGDDHLIGGGGNDGIIGGPGSDRLYGGTGRDVIKPGSGADIVDGGDGVDIADYRTSRDGIQVNLETGVGIGGEADGDTLVNIESVYGSRYADDVLIGNALRNNLRGDKGADYIVGGLGNDVIFVNGSSPDSSVDTIVYRPGDGSDIILDFDVGRDLVDLTATRLSYDQIVSRFIGVSSSSYQINLRDLPGAGDTDQIIFSGLKSKGLELTEANFLLNPNNAPIVFNPLTDRSSPEDTAFSFTLPADTFSDPDDDTLNVTAFLADGSELPDWLSFDSGTRTFSGTPPRDFNGSLDVRITASDGELEASDTFTLEITPVNDAPVVASEVGDKVSAEDVVVSFTLPADTFADVDGDALTLSARLTDGSELPAWLSFDGETQTFSGTPPQDFNGILDVTVYANDGEFETSDTFALEITPVNDAPVAANDGGFEANTGETTTISASELLANDSDPDGDPLTITHINGTAMQAGWSTWVDGAGVVTLGGDNSLTIAPEAGMSGDYSFTYTVSDGNGGTDTAIVRGTILPGNSDPVANDDDDISVVSGGTVNVYPLSNDSDADGGSLTITHINGQALVDGEWTGYINGVGVVQRHSDNSLTIHTHDAPTGVTSFEYTVDDGNGGTDTATVTFTITSSSQGNVVTGTGGNDVIDSSYVDADGDGVTDGNDHLKGKGGKDILVGGAGGDILDGGAGKDTASYFDASSGVVANLTNSSVNTGDASGDSYISIENLTGSAFADRLTGNAAANRLDGGGGKDILNGGAGNDKLNGGAGYDVFNGGDGKDILSGGKGNDTLSGGNGHDRLFGGAGRDKLYGNSGNDILNGGAGTDTLVGGAGFDTFVFKEGYGSDTIIDFAIGVDVVRLDVDGVGSFSNLMDTAWQQGGDAVFDFGNGDALILQGTQLAALDSDAFTFF